MSVGDLIAGPFTYELNGLGVGGPTSPYSVVQIDGLGDQPDTVTADRTQLRRHGLYPGDDFLQGRTITVTLEAVATATVDFNTAVNALMAAVAPANPEAPFVFQIPGVADGIVAYSSVRPRKRAMSVSSDYTLGNIATVDLELYATDPRLYDLDYATDSTGLPSEAGGMVFPLVFPLTFGMVGTGGSMIASNDGTFASPVVFRIEGPVQNPSIENVTLGRMLALDLTIGVGDYLLIDTKTRSVLLDGTASRYPDLTADSQWFDLAPGDNELQFQADVFQTGAQLSYSFQSAWT